MRGSKTCFYYQCQFVDEWYVSYMQQKPTQQVYCQIELNYKGVTNLQILLLTTDIHDLMLDFLGLIWSGIWLLSTFESINLIKEELNQFQ